MCLYYSLPLRLDCKFKYKKYGFEECEAYYHNPFDDVIYMKKYL